MSDVLMQAADNARRIIAARTGDTNTAGEVRDRNQEAMVLLNSELGGKVLQHLMDAEGLPRMYHLSRLTKWFRDRGINARAPYQGLMEALKGLGHEQATLSDRMLAYQEHHHLTRDLGHSLGK